MISGDRRREMTCALSLAAAGLVLLFSLIRTPELKFAMAWTARMLAPAEWPARMISRGFRAGFEGAADRQELLAAIEDLKARERRLSADLALSKELDVRQAVSDRGEFVIDFRDPQAWWDEVRLDMAGQPSPQKGSPAVKDAGLVGLVTDSAQGRTWVRLITSADSYVPVVAEEARDVGVAVGDGNGRVWLRYVAPSVTLQKGERIVTSIGAGGLMPGVLVGVLTGNVERPSPDLIDYEIAPAAPLSRLQSLGFLEKGQK